MGKPTFDHHLKGIQRAFHDMARPYTSVVQAKGTQFGYVTFELGLHYQDTTVVREVGPFDMAEDFDQERTQKKIGAALADAAKDAIFEMMDPTGELKTLSVKEVYAGTHEPCECYLNDE